MSSRDELRYASTVEQIKEYLLDQEEEVDDEFTQMQHLVTIHDDTILRLEANDQEQAAVIRSVIQRLESRMRRLETAVEGVEARLASLENQ